MEIKEQKVKEIRNCLEQIILEVESCSKKGKQLHEVEKGIFSHLLRLGLELLEYYIMLIGIIVKNRGVPLDSEGKKMKNTGLRQRSYVSIFGRLGINRAKHYSKTDKIYYAIDEQLGLPRNNYSYVLSEWVSYGAVEMDFAQSAQQIGRILGQRLEGMQASRLSYDLSTEVSNYYEQRDWSVLSEPDGDHLSVGFDGKGVPIRREETGQSKQSVSARLGRGQKRGVKKEATVSVSSSFTANQRSVEDIISKLFRTENKIEKEPNKRPHKWHEQKHLRAFLSDKPKAIEYGIDQLLDRDPSGKKPIVVLIDGDRALENAVKKTVQTKGIKHRVKAYILDFIHLLEYVWKVANAHLGEKHVDREKWVEYQARLLLTSRTEQVLKHWRVIANKKGMTKTQKYNVERAITYLSNHLHMVKYKTYLRRGYPITTGAVESACGHFVKSRMQRNAMHWSKEGAQKMLDIRAIKKNGDWDDYIKDFIQKEQLKLYKTAA